MNKNKMAPPIRFQGFIAPWEQRKLSEFVKNVAKRNRDNLALEAYAVTNDRGFIAQKEAHDDFGYMSNVDRTAYNIVPPNSFAYNPARINVGSLGYYEGSENVIVSSLYEVFQTADYIDDRFLLHWLKSEHFPKWIEKLQEGSVRLYFYFDKLVQCQLLVPSLSEQRRISSYLDTIDDLITLHQRKLEQQKKLKAFFLKNMFPEEGETVPRIRFKGFTGDWEQRKLGEIGTTFSGLSGKAKEDFGHGEAQFVTYMNVYLNAVSDSSMTERVEIDDHQNKVQYGDVFFTTSSETPDEVGMASVWFGSKDNTYLNSFCFGFRPTKEIDPYYMAFMLRSDIIRRKIIILAQGISRYNLSKKQVMKIVVPLPELSEQYKIGAYLQGLDHLITLHQRKLDQLQVMKKFMLQNLFV